MVYELLLFTAICFYLFYEGVTEGRAVNRGIVTDAGAYHVNRLLEGLGIFLAILVAPMLSWVDAAWITVAGAAIGFPLYEYALARELGKTTLFTRERYDLNLLGREFGWTFDERYWITQAGAGLVILFWRLVV